MWVVMVGEYKDDENEDDDTDSAEISFVMEIIGYCWWCWRRSKRVGLLR